MPIDVTIGELDRRTQDRHSENQRVLAAINDSVRVLADRVGVQNGRLNKLEIGAAVYEAHRQVDQRTIDEVKAIAAGAVEEIRTMASDAARLAAKSAAAQNAAIDALPGSKRLTIISAVAAGVTTGAIVGLWKVGQIILELLK
jgi:hypothetical protein